MALHAHVPRPGVMWIIGIASPEVHQLETVLVDKLEARIHEFEAHCSLQALSSISRRMS